MIEVIFTPAARSELLEAQDWYEAQQLRLGTQFREQLQATVVRMAENPCSDQTLELPTNAQNTSSHRHRCGSSAQLFPPLGAAWAQIARDLG